MGIQRLFSVKYLFVAKLEFSMLEFLAFHSGTIFEAINISKKFPTIFLKFKFSYFTLHVSL